MLRIVTEEKHAKEGKEADPKMLEMLETVTAQKLDSQSTALYGTASLWDDGLVDPRDSRRLLGYLLDICAEAEGAAAEGQQLRGREVLTETGEPATAPLPALPEGRVGREQADPAGKQ